MASNSEQPRPWKRNEGIAWKSAQGNKRSAPRTALKTVHASEDEHSPRIARKSVQASNIGLPPGAARKSVQVDDVDVRRKNIASSASSSLRMSVVAQPSTARHESAADAGQTIPIVKKKYDFSYHSSASQGPQMRQVSVRYGTKGVARDVAEPGRYAVAGLQYNDNDDSDEERATNHRPSILRMPLKRARKTMAVTQIARKTVVNNMQRARGDVPIDDDEALARAIHALSIKNTPDTFRSPQHLPFLRRNVRRHLRHSDADEPDSNYAVKLHKTFILDGRRYEGYYSFGWRCPLCPIKVQFETKNSLDYHLSMFHDQCEYQWSRSDDEVRLEIFLPQRPRTQDDELESESSEEEPPSSPSNTDESEPENAELPSPFSLNAGWSQSGEKKEYLAGPSVARARSVAPSSPLKKQPSSPTLSTISLDEAAVQRHEIPEHFIHGRRETHVERPARPIDAIDPERYPTPPPLRNLEGPSAVYPYVALDAYSARPGGPRLYDILNELSLEEFGLLSWSIVEREEELFELPHIRDEDKVAQALWIRWITLNRNEFVKDYVAGVKSFIDQYWRYIHRAAGLAALRVLLLVLGKHRFLTAADLGDLLTHYRALVGFDLWRMNRN